VHHGVLPRVRLPLALPLQKRLDQKIKA